MTCAIKPRDPRNPQDFRTYSPESSGHGVAFQNERCFFTSVGFSTQPFIRSMARCVMQPTNDQPPRLPPEKSTKTAIHRCGSTLYICAAILKGLTLQLKSSVYQPFSHLMALFLNDLTRGLKGLKGLCTFCLHARTRAHAYRTGGWGKAFRPFRPFRMVEAGIDDGSVW